MAKLNKTVIAALTRIQGTGRAQEADKPLIAQGLIEVNPEDVVNNEAAARLTQKGFDGMPKAATSAINAPGQYAIINAKVVLPESKRGFGRTAGPSKYPFADLQVGGSFFVPNTDVEGGDAFKKLGSTVSNMNNKYRTETAEKKEITRKVKGGNGEKETVNLPVYKQDKKFAIRAVKSGTEYGEWTAPADGALIARTL